MVIKKFSKLRLSKADVNDDLGTDERLRCSALIAPGGTCKWVGQIEFTIDTGSDIVVIPRPILESLGLDNLPVVETGQSELADGSIAKDNIVLIDLRIITEDGGKYVLQNVPCSIPESGEEPLLGLSILKFFEFSIVSNQLIVFRPSQAFAELDDYEPQVMNYRRLDGGRLQRIDAENDNINDKDNSATPLKPIERPKLPEPHLGPKMPMLPKMPKPPEPPVAPKPPSIPQNKYKW